MINKKWRKAALLLLLVFSIITLRSFADVYAKDVVASKNSLYKSKENGFKISFPSKPDINTLDNQQFTLKNYQAHSLADGHYTQYNVFFESLKNGKIFDDASIDAYFKNVPGQEGMLLKQKSVTFLGFKATEYEVKKPLLFQNSDYTRRAITFIVDGDPITIAVLEPANVEQGKSRYNEFKESFKLESIDIPVSNTEWANTDVGFYPPEGWSEKKRKPPIIASFSNESGIALELMQAPLKDVNCKEFAAQSINGLNQEGFFNTEFEIQEYHITMRSISNCIEKNGYAYVLTGKAPKETFFRWNLILQKSLKTLR